MVMLKNSDDTAFSRLY